MKWFSYLLIMSSAAEVVLASPRRHPLPPCANCVPSAQIIAPGIGIDLTTSYGTVAIRYHDGSIKDICKIDAGPEYKMLMHRLSSGSSKQAKVSQFWAILYEILDLASRGLSKFLGRPATKDIGTIADLIIQLKLQTEIEMGTSIDSAVISTSNLFGEDNIARRKFQQDLEEASLYAGLEPLLSPFWLGAPAAAAASQGWGVCKQYTDIYACEAEEEDMAIEMVLAVEYTRASLVITLFPLQSARSNSDEQTIVSFEAGAENDAKNGYWELVLEVLLRLPQNEKRPLAKVVLMGESGRDETFLSVLRDALSTHIMVERLNLSPTGYDPLYSAARGAAEFAKRKQEAPKGCVESDYCKEVRKQLEQKSGRGQQNAVPGFDGEL